MERHYQNRRLLLQSKLEALLDSPNVYFQPPESVRLEYPCIVYERGTGTTRHADNNPYHFIPQYEITYIDPDPDAEMFEKLAMALPSIRHVRHFKSDNLNHDVYELYF